MPGNYLITQQEISRLSSDLILLKTIAGQHIYVNSGVNYYETCDLTIVITGYVQPRNNCFEEYKSQEKLELIKKLYKDYGEKFINYVKGVFTIIIISNKAINLYTDHFGLSSFYICKSNKIKAVSDSINLFKCIGFKPSPDINNQAVKTLLHRTPATHNIYKEISRSKPASHINISQAGFKNSSYWNKESLLHPGENSRVALSFDDFAVLIKENFKKFSLYSKPDQHLITLTGGKDSRTGLAALKALGINPYGFTYGNPLSRDAVYAHKLSKKVSMPHFSINPPDNESYFNNLTSEILSFGNTDVGIHRAHRLYAFSKMASIINGTKAYYSGYMAGEFLMGIYYDNLIFTNYLTDFWNTSERANIEPLLENYFHRPGTVNLDKVNPILDELGTFDSSKSRKEQQFHGIFEIGIPHYSQDIFLASRYYEYVYPFFIDIDFLEILFQSRFNFFYADNKSNNLFNRYKLYEFNLNIQHILYPYLDNIPFGKRGSYSTKEFLKGKYYWALVKTLRYFFQKRKYPVTYSYGKPFRNFILKHLIELDSDREHILHDYYDIGKAISTLQAINGYTDERPMHRFSNIMMQYLQMKKFNNTHFEK